jgi:toxin ParE1/3/4
MKKPFYSISRKAVEDLENIWLYTLEKWSEKEADRYYGLIIDEIEFLVENFNSGKSMGHIKEGYRASVIKSHLVFYRKPDSGQLEVVRILHQSMDIENRIQD